MRYGQLKFGDFGQKKAKKGLTICSAYFCHLNHFCHSSQLLSIHINHFCERHRFCQLLSTQSSPVLSQISTTYVTTDEVTTFVNRSAHFCRPHIFFLSMNGIQSHFEENCFYLIIWFLVNQILPTPICLLFTIRETT